MDKPPYIGELSAFEAERCQVAMLYPWELADWERGTLELSEKDPRFHLMRALEARVDECVFKDLTEGW